MENLSGVSVSFSICSLLFMIIFAFVYFSKKRVNLLENKMYSVLLISVIIGLVLDIGGFFSFIYLGVDSYISILISKVYLIYYFTWTFFLTLYTFIVSFKERFKSKNIEEKMYHILAPLFTAFYVIFALIITFLPLHIKFSNNATFSYGPSVNFLYSIVGICIMVMLISIVSNFKNIKKRKYLPLIALIVLATVISMIQKYNPSLLLMITCHAVVTALMYFTIENPDVRMIEELNIARDQADKANQAKTDFLSNMSHEIRTPLNVIVGFSHSLLDEDISDKARENIKYIVSASDNLLDLVNGILDISKIEAGKLEIVDTQYDITKVLNELVVLTKSRIGEKPIEFRTSFDSSMPKYLYGDYARVKQICVNLLTNSVKYTNQGYIEFKVDHVRQGDIIRLIISVEDTGIGIKKDNIDKLFKKFERLDLEKNISIEGTGLGLAITQKLVEMMNGKIVVQSDYGEGSKFTVAIDQRIVTDPVNVLARPKVQEKQNYANKKVLVVDDNKLNLKVAEKYLEPYKCEVTTVSSGEECLDKINSNEYFDLILLDDMMPHMSGVETLKRLKTIDGFNIPVVMMTANAITGMKEKYLHDGFDDYLSKPIEKEELKRVLSTLLK